MVNNDPRHNPLDRDALRQASDERLVEILLSGGQDAMAEIFERYYHMVMRVALHVVRDTGEAQDVVQAVFTEFYQKAELFDAAKGSLKTWLLQYSYGRSINRKRSLQSRNFYDQVELEGLDAAPVTTSSRILDLNSPEAAILVEQMLAVVNERQRNVIELVMFRGMTLAETARKLDESLGNVQHLYFRGLEKMRSHLRAAEKKSSGKAEAKFGVQLLQKLRRGTKKNYEDGEVEIVKARAL